MTTKDTEAPSIATLTKPQCRKLQGFSKENERNYTIGLMSMILTASMTVRFPAYYWIWHLMRMLFYFPVRYFRFRKNGWELYLLDWCYVVSYITTACSLLAFLRIMFGIETALHQYNGTLIRAGFAMCCGPLIWSVYVFRNSIVFHDLDYMTSVFIHMSPFLVMWCLRWGAGVPSVINEAFPDMFRVCASKEEFAAADACLETFRGALWCNACHAPFLDFVVPPAFVYLCVWSIPYFYFVCVRWSDWIKDTKRETLVMYFVETNPELNEYLERKMIGIGVGRRYASPLGYMLFHFTSTIALAGSSYFLWHSFLLHTILGCFALTTAVHNGGQYMFRVFAYRYAAGEFKKHQAVLD